MDHEQSRHEAKIRDLEVEKAKAEVDKAKTEIVILNYSCCPHRLWPVAIYREGQQWACELTVMQDPMKNVIAWGSSPIAACTQFDLLWNGDVIELDEPDEEF